jgi:4-hydroxy-3-methylbut-2-enyl diphosphate reductase
VTAGASTPEFLVKELIRYLEERGISGVQELEGPDENVTFQLPSALVAGRVSRPTDAR